MRDFDLNSNIEDKAVRENFQKVQEWVDENIFEHFVGRHFEIGFSQAETNFRYPHNLGFQPMDVIQTRLTGTGSVTWNHDLFDTDNLDITVSGACSVRAFIGRFEED